MCYISWLAEAKRLEEAASREEEEEEAVRKRAKATELRHLSGVFGSSIRTARYYDERTGYSEFARRWLMLTYV